MAKSKGINMNLPAVDDLFTTQAERDEAGRESVKDMAVTKRLRKCGALLDIELLDHIIVGRSNDFFSKIGCMILQNVYYNSK